MKAHVGSRDSMSWIEIEMRDSHSIPRELTARQRRSEVDLVEAAEPWRGPARSSRTEHQPVGQLFEIGGLIIECHRSVKVPRLHELDRPLATRSDDADVQR
jgi:hypothetical protein